MSFPFVYPEPDPALFLSARLVANSTPSISDATVSTPPTIAQVLRKHRTT